MAEPITSCIFPECGKPLGAESRDLDYRLCHEHRKCYSCQHPLHWKEIHTLLDELTENGSILELERIQHARCVLVNMPNGNEDPSILVRQSYLDRLNQARLLILPNADLSIDTNEKQADILTGPLIAGMTLDQQIVFMKRMEAIVAHVSIALSKNRVRIKEVLEEREKGRAQKAKQERETSSRPVSKSSDDLVEVMLAAFMQRNGIVERKVALKVMRDRMKAIDGLTSVGMSKDMAEKAVDAQFVKMGKMKV